MPLTFNTKTFWIKKKINLSEKDGVRITATLILVTHQRNSATEFLRCRLFAVESSGHEIHSATSRGRMTPCTVFVSRITHLCVDDEQLTAAVHDISSNIRSIHINHVYTLFFSVCLFFLPEHVHAPISICLHLQGRLCQRHLKVAGPGAHYGCRQCRH